MKALRLILTFALTLPVFAGAETSKIKIEDVAFKATGENKAQVTIKFASPVNDIPELTVKDNMVQVAVAGAFVWPKIEKNVSMGSSDAKLMAYQFDKDLVRVRAMLPFSLAGRENQVSIVMGTNSVELNFPTVGQAKTTAAPAPVKPAAKNNGNAYDTNYLEKLLSDKELREIAAEANKKEQKAPAALPTGEKNAKDEVNVTLSATDRDVNAPFSVANYLGKFVAFLGVVLLVFYAAANLMKKGVLKKGKLGFLNSTKTVEVLSTTFVGPKRNVMLIRAHDQVFLVGSSENGLQLISEINNPAGLMKEGERRVAGDNFDTQLTATPEKEFRLKDTIDANRAAAQTADVTLDKFLDSKATQKVKDKVRFSDQIKSKVKTLKPLQ